MMRLIPVKQAENILEQVCKPGKNVAIVLLTRKKDHSLKIERSKHLLTVTEQGYRNETKRVPLDNHEDKVILRQAFKREFPRSHEVYINSHWHD
ncbi:hypothetical protein [Furfurilactobacillus milii]|nr:hypothetical protein [Furfurilactobacillus milii]